VSFESRKFHSYDPYATYANPENRRFVKSSGGHLDEDNCATVALFQIGKEAFTRLFDGCTQAEFEEAYSGYYDFLEEMQPIIQNETKSKGIVYKSVESGQQIAADLERLEESQLVSLIWQFYSSGALVGADKENNEQPLLRKEADLLMMELFFLYALREIDNALMFHRWGPVCTCESIASSIDAANALGNGISIELGSEKEQEIRRNMAYRGAIEKLKRDPKQMAKSLVKECWVDWQRKPTSYKGKSAFAKDMMSKFEELDSQTVITRWCGQWEKEAAK